MKYFLKDIDHEITPYFRWNVHNFSNEVFREKLKDFTFYEFSLEELGLPSYTELLESINRLEKTIGLLGWQYKDFNSKMYKGFSFTYNPDYKYSDISKYHQTLGSKNLEQVYGKEHGKHEETTKNGYYDTYRFRKVLPEVKNELYSAYSKFNMPMLRSRVAYVYAQGLELDDNRGWHVDEAPFELLRVNIPLQTSIEHILDISGEDEFGNKFELKNKHLEVGKAYIWNTRIPHRVAINKPVLSPEPRIHIVFGFSPWYNYNSKEDYFEKSSLWGLSLKEIVENKMWQKSPI